MIYIADVKIKKEIKREKEVIYLPNKKDKIILEW